LKESHEGVPRKAKSGIQQSQAPRPEVLEAIRLRQELLGGHPGTTRPKVAAVERAFAAGFTPGDVRRALESVRRALDGPSDAGGLACFCATRNRSFEYLFRPATLQALLDQATEGPQKTTTTGRTAQDLPLFSPERTIDLPAAAAARGRR
jgi:hypothetical protein